ncbi:MAG: peptidase [Cyanobacteriota bacterium]|nr:peptidase [Cyanobacteriota bacterium]
MIPAAPDCAPVEQRRLLSPEDRQRLAVPPSPPEASPRPAYADRLQPSSLGWVSRRSWCVWIEPDPQPDRFSGLWRQAVDTALARWGRELTLQPVERADDAHIRLWRRRPPRQDGRASLGRALLSLQMVRRGGAERPEPLVDVLLDPGQRLQGLQATALHELGHGFGLWGHSDRPDDVMTAVPGPRPPSDLSPRDRETLRWLLGRPSLFRPEPPAPTP